MLLREDTMAAQILHIESLTIRKKGEVRTGEGMRAGKQA